MSGIPEAVSQAIYDAIDRVKQDHVQLDTDEYAAMIFAAMVEHNSKPSITRTVSTIDGATLIMIDTAGDDTVEHLRIDLNDGTIYNGNPELHSAPGIPVIFREVDND